MPRNRGVCAHSLWLTAPNNSKEPFQVCHADELWTISNLHHSINYGRKCKMKLLIRCDKNLITPNQNYRILLLFTKNCYFAKIPAFKRNKVITSLWIRRKSAHITGTVDYWCHTAKTLSSLCSHAYNWFWHSPPQSFFLKLVVRKARFLLSRFARCRRHFRLQKIIRHSLLHLRTLRLTTVTAVENFAGNERSAWVKIRLKSDKLWKGRKIWFSVISRRTSAEDSVIWVLTKLRVVTFLRN